MKGVCLKVRLAGCALLVLSGCVSSQNTRMPTLAYGDPRAERRSYDFHDPLPESNVGPLVERPRGAERQRSEPRRTLEHVPPGMQMSGSATPSASRYPDVVTP